MRRVNVLDLLVDQFRSMRRTDSGTGDWVARGILLIVGPALFTTSWLSGWRLQSTGELASALGLASGVFLSAFAIVLSVRVTIAARPTTTLTTQSARLIDESALTVLAAALLAGVDASWLAIVTATTPKGCLPTVTATAVTAGLSAVVIVYFLLAIRRLHVLYTDTYPPAWRKPPM